MLLLLIILISLILSIVFFMRQEKFGKAPVGARLEIIKKSPNYKNGQFQNLNNTPALTEGVTYTAVLKEFLFTKKERKVPTHALPAIKTDLKNLDKDKDVLIWFGHSSYFMQIDGRKILVDPVLNGTASPVSFTTKAFIGTHIYTASDMPEIDILFITHDHWDHLDYLAVKQLKPKIKKIVCSLGVGQHLEHWKFDPAIIHELDWYDKASPCEGFVTFATPARHFSGRSFKRNQSLWNSYVLITPTAKIFIGGDSGYDTHFSEIGKKFGPFDLAILENGQYDKSWKYIHMMPEEVLQAAVDLGAERLIPVHSSKFSLSNHAWDDPLERISRHKHQFNLTLVTPVIGEPVLLKNKNQVFTEWWKAVK
jgi:L-ascorbate metabolism protein UlaG (beta-lactamase superfamily)